MYIITGRKDKYGADDFCFEKEPLTALDIVGLENDLRTSFPTYQEALSKATEISGKNDFEWGVYDQEPEKVLGLRFYFPTAQHRDMFPGLDDHDLTAQDGDDIYIWDQKWGTINHYETGTLDGVPTSISVLSWQRSEKVASNGFSGMINMSNQDTVMKELLQGQRLQFVPDVDEDDFSDEELEQHYVDTEPSSNQLDVNGMLAIDPITDETHDDIY